MSEAVVRCSCGSVEIHVFDAPIASVACYCDTCQQGSRAIEALPNAAPVLDANGGTEYVAYRLDRVEYLKGSELLVPLKIDTSATSRVYASCCNTAMFMKFDDARHWVSIYRARFQNGAPPVEFRICTKFKPENAVIPNDVPASAMYPFAFMMKLLKSKLAMLLRPRKAGNAGAV